MFAYISIKFFVDFSSYMTDNTKFLKIILDRMARMGYIRGRLEIDFDCQAKNATIKIHTKRVERSNTRKTIITKTEII